MGYEIKELEKLAQEGRKWSTITTTHQHITPTQLKQGELQNSYNELVYSGKAKRLMQLKPPILPNTIITRESYIKNDPPIISKYRARFRFNCAKTNEILYKYKQRSDDYCDECEDQTETRDHLLYSA